MATDWFFDVISPYAFLQCHALNRRPDLDIRYRPLLFAGLLNHWGQLGPAEIAPKREFTYRHCLWLGRRQGLSMRAPRGHPFNPLPLLRLIVAAGATRAAVTRVFDHVWRDAGALERGAEFDTLAAELGVDPDAVDGDAVKRVVRDNGDDAIRLGVFGVPTLVVDGIALWGQDAIAMLDDIRSNPDAFAELDAEAAAVTPLAERRPT